jgi:hypothetical protein
MLLLSIFSILIFVILANIVFLLFIKNDFKTDFGAVNSDYLITMKSEV